MSQRADAPLPRELPAIEVGISIHRDDGVLRVEDAELRAPRTRGRIHQQLRWIVRGEMLPDELLIVFGKPLEWTGPRAPDAEEYPTVEALFSSPILLSPRRPVALSGPARLPEIPPDEDAVAWAYGVVLLRGRDTPWIDHALVRVILDSAA